MNYNKFVGDILLGTVVAVIGTMFLAPLLTPFIGGFASWAGAIGVGLAFGLWGMIDKR